MPENTKGRLKASKNQTWKRGYRSKGPSTSMKIRANAVILSVILGCAAFLTVNLFRIMIIQHKEYTDKANSRQFNTVVLPAARGSIYDANGAVLAQSATVYRIFLDPTFFRKEMELIEERNKELETSAAKKRSAGEQAEADTVDTAQIKEQLIVFLAETLELEQDFVRSAFESTGKYFVLKKQVEKSKADSVLAYVSDIRVPGSSRSIKLASVSRESDTKRYYPQNELAASVIGFNNADGHGIYGIEAYYDSYLSGIDGKTITARDANGNEMPYRYSKTFAAQDGDDVYVTIDMTLQTYLENAMTDMVDTYKVAKRGAGIMLNAKTGAVLAMATVGGFDLNDPYTIYDPEKAAEVDAIEDEDKRLKALNEAREMQWRNKCVTETYIPGSVFKVYTASASLEEDKVNYYNDTFNCVGHVNVAGTLIHCSRTRGHGVQTFEEILKNSCNPAFIELGQRLGKDLFCQYFEAYGLTEKTGIDLPGETSSIYTPLKKMGPVELAASSYGQNNSLSPIEMVTGYAAVVNGGYLLQPYVVSKVVDSEGNTVLSNEKTVRRQVISAETSAKMRRALQFVVDNNGGSNAYIKGYKIGGKSGTSQKLMGNVKKGEEQFVASYCCFAPADDPEIVLLILADEPDKTITYYGSTVVAPYSRSILEKALPYLGFYPEYTAEESEHLDVTVPLLIDMPVGSAKKALEDLGLKAEQVGEGESVNMQFPITGTGVAKGGTVLLYTGASEDSGKVTVPALAGTTAENSKTLAEANEILAKAGLNYVAKGSMQENSIVLKQSIPPGTSVDRWTVIELDLGTAEDAG
ncbi:MAG: PASTA domain-containing protein [Oscillospiraceae bacterium]|nr:PASTA domain-containing protein [Oscillospiraceae bacterium]